MVSHEIVKFLQANGWSQFYNSLLYQYNTKGYLTPNQIACVEKAIVKASQPKPPPSERVYSILSGARIEVKAWLARRLQADLSMDFFFRNLEVVEVQNETLKAYQVKVKFVSQIVTNCHICGKELDNDISRATGIGPVCAAKMGLPRPTLETASETLKAIDEKCQAIGSVGPIWIPKSQIK